MVHHDLKPQSILLASESDCNSIKLANFGFASVVGSKLSDEMCGTPYYTAPEIIRRAPHGTVSAGGLRCFFLGCWHLICFVMYMQLDNNTSQSSNSLSRRRRSAEGQRQETVSGVGEEAVSEALCGPSRHRATTDCN